MQKMNILLRTFSLTLPDGSKREVKQLQTEQWPDLSVPDNPRLLLDLVHKAKALHQSPGWFLFLRKNCFPVYKGLTLSPKVPSWFTAVLALGEQAP